MMEAFLAGTAFAAAALAGVVVARFLCSGCAPFEDGPAPVVVSPWLIVFAGSCVGVGVALHGASALELTGIGLSVVVLAAVTVSDFSIGIVPDTLTLLPLAVLIVIAAIAHNYEPLISAVLVALPLAIAAVLSRGRGMGWGDVKLAAFGGALLGAQGAFLGFAAASVAVFIGSRFAGLRGKPIAFAPYLAGGIGAVLIFGSRF